MSTDIVVRALEPADMQDLTEAWNQPNAVAQTLQLPFTSVDTRQQRNATTPPNFTKLVAVIDGKVIGSIYLDRFDGRRRHVGTVGMAVHDAYAGRGAGGALMTAALSLADDWLNLSRIELTVFADNARAIALYERFGFEREGLHRAYAYRGGAYADCLAMARVRL
jgi:putative acetyltransferase